MWKSTRVLGAVPVVSFGSAGPLVGASLRGMPPFRVRIRLRLIAEPAVVDANFLHDRAAPERINRTNFLGIRFDVRRDLLLFRMNYSADASAKTGN